MTHRSASAWWPDVADVTWVPTTWRERWDHEALTIWHLYPLHNVALNYRRYRDVDHKAGRSAA